MSEIQIFINEEYLELVPRPNPQDYKALQESIIVHGQREPIICNEKYQILDGHTRFEILQNLGLKPKFRIEKFETETLERGYVIEANLKRRHLTSFQKVELSYSLFLTMKAESQETTKANMGKVRNGKPIKSKGRITDNLGREIGVGRNAFQMALKLIETAPFQMKAQLRSGTISISAAYHKLNKPIPVKYVKKDPVVKCPCCEKTFNKSELITNLE